MSFFFYDEPIHESDRSILNNSVCDDSRSDSDSENGYYYSYPLISGYPGIYYAYPPYLYHPQAQAQAQAPPSPSLSQSSLELNNSNSNSRIDTESDLKQSPKPMFKSTTPNTKKNVRRAAHSLDKDVYKLVDFRPNNDLYEDDNNYYIQLDLPGMSKEQIHMELSEDRILTISGKRENKFKKSSNDGEEDDLKKKKKNGMKISKMDCQYGKFSISFNIHETADLDKIEAKMENGVLEVIIPKSDHKTQRRVIQVQ